MVRQCVAWSLVAVVTISCAPGTSSSDANLAAHAASSTSVTPGPAASGSTSSNDASTNGGANDAASNPTTSARPAAPGQAADPMAAASPLNANPETDATGAGGTSNALNPGTSPEPPSPEGTNNTSGAAEDQNPPGAEVGGANAQGSATPGPDAGTGSLGTAELDAGSLNLSVMTFNIRYDNGRNQSDQNAWNASTNPRRERVLSVIRNATPDLLGVQEALNNQVRDLTGALSEYGFLGVGRDDGKTQGEYAGIFYRLERFSLVDSGQFWLSETPEVAGTVFAGSGSVRIATWCVLEDSHNGRELFFLDTHWDNVSQSSREASATLIRERLASLGQGRPLIMTGDLNQSESNAAIQTLLNPEPDVETQLFDAYREVFPQPSPEEATFHDFTGTTQGSRIDYVLHDTHFTASQAMIHRDQFDALYASDHYAVSAVLMWAE